MFHPITTRKTNWRVYLVLPAILLLTFVLCFHGSNWGRVESWHPDQMALGGIKSGDGYLLRPDDFKKPPFHKYVNYVFSKLPNRALEDIFGASRQTRDIGTFRTSRMLTILLFLGCVSITFAIVNDFFSGFVAAILSALLATSAGYVAFAHFLTADIPVLFWMLAAFWFASRILRREHLSDYVFAGLLTGVATATKYNGLAVGIALVVAHLLRTPPKTWPEWKRAALSRPLLLGLVAVLAGFLLANPYAIIDYQKFVSDFVYNYKVTPIYGGEAEGSTYLEFLLCGSELFGWPLLTVTAIALITSLYLALGQERFTLGSKLVLLSCSVFLLYYIKFGAFPRMETRFTLPAFPFLLLATAPYWALLSRKTAVILSVPILAYGVVSSILVGARFNNDPRMLAQEWVIEHIDAGVVMETMNSHVPRFDKLPSVHLKHISAPYISPRSRMFLDKFEEMQDLVRTHDPDDTSGWYTGDRLKRRNPDYVAINSLAYQEFLSGTYAAKFPDLAAFFNSLLSEQLGYQIVFDQKSESPPWWVYPRRIDFLDNRMTILARNELAQR